MNRRSALTLLGGITTNVLCRHTLAHQLSKAGASRLGLVIYCCRFQRQQRQMSPSGDDLFKPFAFLEHCGRLGAGGMQAALGTMPEADAERLKAAAEDSGLFVEAIIKLPRDNADVSRFDAEMETARRTGASATRTTIIPGRRYEYFDSLEKFRHYEQLGREALQRAVPVAEKHRLPVAVENHKDHRNEERLALLKSISSEYVGACVDTGNSVALLEDPLETVKEFAPWAKSVHLKDQGLRSYEDGFLLADIPLGQGDLDLKRMVDLLRKEQPDVNFSLELITRDPLKVPCFTENYWATFPDLPAHQLAETLRLVHSAKTDPLQSVSDLTLAEQAELELANITTSLQYAQQQLGL